EKDRYTYSMTGPYNRSIKVSVASRHEASKQTAHAEAESTLPAEPDASAIEAVVVELHRRALADPRFAGQH
ncbi:MAG: hypothetical protein R6W76_09690, partial [Caldilinea sp.]